jgi:VWFA-related protein
MRRLAPTFTFVLLVLLALGNVPARSQIRTRVDLVVVPVSVRDGDGKLVNGLKAEDFILEEDGKPQTISSFSIEPQQLSAAIVVDDGMGGDSLRRLAPLFPAVVAGFSPDDEMAAFRYDHFVWKLADFTNDPERIQKSFDIIAKIAETRPAQGEPGDPLSGGPSILSNILGIFNIGSNGPPPTVPSSADAPKRPRTSRLLHDAIYEAAIALRDRPKDRRKLIMIISDGQVSGANKQSLERNIDLLLRNDIQVYAVATDFALLEGSFGALGTYARATGGDAFNGATVNNMENAFSRITEQSRNQYILGYYSTNSAPGIMGVHREIDVRTKVPGQRATHRRGYIQYPAP